MEYIPGGATLRSAMSEEGFHPDEIRMREWLTNYFLPLLDGVQALHDLGIVHRDLRPENILLDRDTPKIADFGNRPTGKNEFRIKGSKNPTPEGPALIQPLEGDQDAFAT